MNGKDWLYITNSLLFAQTESWQSTATQERVVLAEKKKAAHGFGRWEQKCKRYKGKKKETFNKWKPPEEEENKEEW